MLTLICAALGVSIPALRPHDFGLLRAAESRFRKLTAPTCEPTGISCFKTSAYSEEWLKENKVNLEASGFITKADFKKRAEGGRGSAEKTTCTKEDFLFDYGGPCYREQNGVLRGDYTQSNYCLAKDAPGGALCYPDAVQAKKAADCAHAALAARPKTTLKTLFRGVNGKKCWGCYHGKDKVYKYATGDTWTDKGFLSTAMDKTVSWATTNEDQETGKLFGNVVDVRHAIVPHSSATRAHKMEEAGTKPPTIVPFGDTEKEILYEPGTWFKIHRAVTLKRTVDKKTVNVLYVISCECGATQELCPTKCATIPQDIEPKNVCTTDCETVETVASKS